MTTRNQPPPPPVNAVDAVQPDQPRRSKYNLPGALIGIIGAAGLVTGGLLGAVIGVSVASDDNTAAPEACLEAIEHADHIIGVTSEAFLDIADAVDALMVYDFDTADRHMNGINGATEQIIDTRDDYLAAKDECRGGE